MLPQDKSKAPDAVEQKARCITIEKTLAGGARADEQICFEMKPGDGCLQAFSMAPTGQLSIAS